MKYERIKKLKEEKFRRLTGIRKRTFEKIYEILKEADEVKIAKGGRKQTFDGRYDINDIRVLEGK